LAGEGVNREVKLTIVTEGEEEATRKINDVIKGLGGSIGGSGAIGVGSPTASGNIAIDALKSQSIELKKQAKSISASIQEAKKEIFSLKGVKGEDASERRQELSDTIQQLRLDLGDLSIEAKQNAIDTAKSNAVNAAELKIKQDMKDKLSGDIGDIKRLEKENKELGKQTKNTAGALKDAVAPANNMRQQLTGMLIWMHTFRVFGEYSGVLKNQFTMLGNALGMIMNQILIPLYPILIGITVMLYRLSSIIGYVMKAMGKWPSAIFAAIVAGLTLAKLFGWLNWTIFGHRAAVDADTAALLRHTGALGVASGGAVAAGGAGLGGAAAAAGAGISFASLGVFIGGAIAGILGTAVGAKGIFDVSQSAMFGQEKYPVKNWMPGFKDLAYAGGDTKRGWEKILAENSAAQKTNQENAVRVAEKHLGEAKVANKFAKEQTQPWYMTIKSYLAGIFALLAAPFNALATAAKNTIGAAIDIGKAIWDWLMLSLKNTWDAVTAIGGAILQWFKDSLGNTWDAIMEIGGLIKQWVKDGFKDPVGLALAILDVIIGWAKEELKITVNLALTIMGEIIEWIKREFKTTYDFAGKIAEIITKWVETTLPGGTIVAGGMREGAGIVDNAKNTAVTEGSKAITITVSNTFHGISDAKQIGETIGNDILRILKDGRNTVTF
jgi:hypothetical protein